MLALSQYFVMAKNSIAEYKGEKIYQGYEYNLKGRHKIKVRVLADKEDAERVLSFFIYHFKGEIYNEQGQKARKPKTSYACIDFDEYYWDNANHEFILEIDLEDGYIFIQNGKILNFGGGKRIVDVGNNWFAMKQEKISPTITRFYCNDADNEDDFDDLIFEIEVLD